MWSRIVKWFEDRIERESLAGFTVDELNQFRKNCVNLCLPTGYSFHVKHPNGMTVQFYPGVLPRFEMGQVKYNLQFPKDAYPHWDITSFGTEIHQCDIASPAASIINPLLKEFVRYFPFAPEPLTGDPIA